MPGQPLDDDLDELVFTYLERVESGSGPVETLAELVEAHPHREDDLRSSLAALRSAGLLESDGELGGGFPKELGGYRLLRRLGAGGMGVVFLAESSDGERVALKLIRPDQLLFGQARARFQRELDSGGRVQHPSLAEVLEAGEQDGIPWLAQQWVPGVSLDILLSWLRTRDPATLKGSDLRAALAARLPAEARGAEFDEASFAGSWESVVVRVVRQIAEALEHAHGQGILHRDVKPSNIVLTPSGRAVLVDFGLASMSEATRLTRTGAQLGSLPYMAPEQIRGDVESIGTRTDVYALGVTLYELFTLRQPYSDKSSERVRRLILEANPTTPKGLNVELTSGASHLCLRAMDLEIGRRYRSAAEFAQDLQRLEQGRPVKARPPAAAMRIGRWVRRRPVQALTLLILIIGPLGWAVFTQWAMSRVRVAYQDEQEARSRADRHLTLTLNAIHDLFTKLADEDLEQTPHLQRTRLVAVDRALETMDLLLAERADDPRVRLETGRLQRQRGNVLGELGRHREAVDAYAIQIELLEGLIDEVSDESERLSYKRELSLALERRAALVIVVDGIDAAIESYDEALLLLREVAEEAAPSSGARAQLVVALNIQADFLMRAAQLEQAAATAAEGRELASVLLDESRVNPQTLQNLANLISIELQIDELRESTRDALADRREVLALLEEAHRLNPLDRRLRGDLAAAYSELGWTLSLQAEHAEGLEVSARGVELSRALVRDFPEVTRYQSQLVQLLSNYAICLLRAEEIERAGELFREQARVAEELYALDRTNSRYAQIAAQALANLGTFQLQSLDDPEGALKSLSGAEATLEVGLRSHPNDLKLHELRGTMAFTSARAHLRLERAEEAQAAVDLFRERVQRGTRGLLQTAHVEAELVLCLSRVGLDSELAFGRCLAALEELGRRGFVDAQELREMEALVEIMEGEPRWHELLAEMDSAARK